MNDADRKAVLFSHLLHEHDHLMTIGEYDAMSLEDMQALDPCEVADA